MRLRLAPPPTTEELLRRTPHEIVRDFPETLSVFRAHGTSLRTAGARAVSRLLDEAGSGEAALPHDLHKAVGWRRES